MRSAISVDDSSAMLASMSLSEEEAKQSIGISRGEQSRTTSGFQRLCEGTIDIEAARHVYR